MENVCHTLCGLAIARAGGDRLGPLATPVIVVAANLPDLDVVTMLLGGKPGYLCKPRRRRLVQPGRPPAEVIGRILPTRRFGGTHRLELGRHDVRFSPERE